MILNQMCPDCSYLIHALSRFALCRDSRFVAIHAVDICSIQHSICGHISVWHLASGIWRLAYDIWYMRSHFEHVHIYLHVHMFTCSHFYHIWKCERRYMRSHSRVKVVEPNDFPRSPTFFLPLTPSSPLIIEHLNIWTFEHLNIGTLEHLDMLISAAFNILYACTFLSALTFLSVLPYLQSSVRMCQWTSICSFLEMWTQIYAVTFLSALTFRLKMWTQISGVESHR